MSVSPMDRAILVLADLKAQKEETEKKMALLDEGSLAAGACAAFIRESTAKIAEIEASMPKPVAKKKASKKKSKETKSKQE